MVEAATRHDAHHIQREAGLAARATAAEQQLAGTHEVLQDAQRAEREASAAAAELREKLRNVTAERDAALSKVENASALLKEACDRAAGVLAERDAARREAAAAQSEVNASRVRLRQAETLEESVQKREREIMDRATSVEKEAAMLREAVREVERREVDAELRGRRLEAR